MTGKFQMSGLSAPKSFTLRHNNDIFWAKSGMSDDRYKALFKYFKGIDGAWTGKEKAILEYDKVSDDGTPIDAKVIEVELP